RGDVLERAIAAIAVERIGERREVFRMAIDADPASGIAAVAVVGGRPFGVVYNPEVEPSVAIVVEPARGHGPFAAADSGSFGDILESPVAQIAIQGIPVDAGYEQVRMTVVIEIAHGRAHRVACAGDASRLGHVAELPSAFVVEQAIPVLRRRLSK